jgi:hypothetical protein
VEYLPCKPKAFVEAPVPPKKKKRKRQRQREEGMKEDLI